MFIFALPFVKLPSSPKSVPVSVSGVEVPAASPPAAAAAAVEVEVDAVVVVAMEEWRTPYPLDWTSSSPSASHSSLPKGPIWSGRHAVSFIYSLLYFMI